MTPAEKRGPKLTMQERKKSSSDILMVWEASCHTSRDCYKLGRAKFDEKNERGSGLYHSPCHMYLQFLMDAQSGYQAVRFLKSFT